MPCVSSKHLLFVLDRKSVTPLSAKIVIQNSLIPWNVNVNQWSLDFSKCKCKEMPQKLDTCFLWYSAGHCVCSAVCCTDGAKAKAGPDNMQVGLDIDNSINRQSFAVRWILSVLIGLREQIEMAANGRRCTRQCNVRVVLLSVVSPFLFHISSGQLAHNSTNKQVQISTICFATNLQCTHKK